jgi:hypothetical protein
MAANEVCISEYADMVSTVRGAAQVAMDPPLAVQILALGGASVPSNAFNALTRMIEITVSGVDARIENNQAAPVANATTSQRISAGQTIYRGVTLGAGNKIAVITAT